ncbi:hypothetical protein AAC387_Pa09g2213 [Persea americana]
MFLTGTNIYQHLGSKHGDQRKKLIIWACSVSLILLVFIATISCLPTKVQGGKAKSFPSQTSITIVSRAIVSACKNTLYKETCISSLRGTTAKTPKEFFELSVQHAADLATSARSHAYNITILDQKSRTNLPTGVDDCSELLEDSVERLSNVLDSTKGASPDDIQTWLSAALTNQETCLDSLKSVNSPLEKELMERAKNSSQSISNSLAMYMSMKGGETKKSVGGGGRRLLSDGFPDWVSTSDRKLLDAPIGEIRPHAVVAKDGSGTHGTIGEALLAASLAAGGGRSVIHVKAGTYSEDSIKIPKGQNIMLVGDGKGVTVITGHKSSNGGYSTFSSATVGVSGGGFIARDISIVNSAGPSGEQAVALRVSSDKAVIYRCALDGYQDTLYTLSDRQFYRETDIYGTVDFIFGNSAAVFQNCNLIAKKSGHPNYVTAQGRSDPNQNTGISIQNCKISGSSNTYLGRPWKKCSRTVVMQSNLDGSINGAGWSQWSGSSGLSTLYYGEYMNTGPGASTSGRVGWSGYHPSLSTEEASKFTVANFISGNQWLPSTGVPFDAGL